MKRGKMAIPVFMTDETSKKRNKPEAGSKEARLAEALRANLRRRKATQKTDAKSSDPRKDH